mgnify:FL=1
MEGGAALVPADTAAVAAEAEEAAAVTDTMPLYSISWRKNLWRIFLLGIP